ncbi:MAG TPA: hypothetical protein PKK61_02710 [Defluviitaleaceae bacterium]|nr:hypothetical protein [Defluviitaleaceae bacterium]
MILATTIGISVKEFWKMTPYELSIAVKGYHKRKEIEAEEYKFKLEMNKKLLALQAFWISRWVWQKKVDIDKILKDDSVPAKSKEMTPEQMLAQVKALNALFGGEIKEI